MPGLWSPKPKYWNIGFLYGLYSKLIKHRIESTIFWKLKTLDFKTKVYFSDTYRLLGTHFESAVLNIGRYNKILSYSCAYGGERLIQSSTLILFTINHPDLFSQNIYLVVAQKWMVHVTIAITLNFDINNATVLL